MEEPVFNAFLAVITMSELQISLKLVGYFALPTVMYFVYIFARTKGELGKVPLYMILTVVEIEVP